MTKLYHEVYGGSEGKTKAAVGGAVGDVAGRVAGAAAGATGGAAVAVASFSADLLSPAGLGKLRHGGHMRLAGDDSVEAETAFGMVDPAVAVGSLLGVLPASED